MKSIDEKVQQVTRLSPDSLMNQLHANNNLAKKAIRQQIADSLLLYVKTLLRAGEPIKALRVLEDAPAVLAGEPQVVQTADRIRGQVEYAKTIEGLRDMCLPCVWRWAFQPMEIR